MENIRRLVQSREYAKRVWRLIVDISNENYNEWEENDYDFWREIMFDLARLYDDKIQDYMTNLENQVKLSA